MIHGGDAAVQAFAVAGWRWGGYWSRSTTTSTSPPPAADPGTRGAGPASFGAEWPGKRDVRRPTMPRPARSSPTPTPARTTAYAHYARKEEIARAAVLGGTITTLCGHHLLAGAGSTTVPGVPEVQGAGGHAVGLRLGTCDGPGSGSDAPP